MQPLEYVTVTCPYCGACYDTEIDISTLPANYVEDCQGCCAPMVLSVSLDPRGGTVTLDIRREND